MKNRILHFTLNSFALLSAFLFTSIFISCGEDSGLGATIDTEAPKMAISYPNPKANNVAMGEFVLAGTCSDDKIVSRVEVAVTNLDSQKSYGSFPATVNAQANTWSITFNTFDDSNGDNYNGYPFPDGNYKFVATAYDNAGHSTQDTSTLEIDNTAPVFVISKPGVVVSETKKESTRISKYGSIFTIEGTIAESHQVSKMDLQIYDENGEKVNAEPYEADEISTTGGTSVTIARYLENGTDETNTRYNDIYGVAGSVADSDGNKRYSCTVTLSDNARIFQNPGDSGTGNGNETSVVYLNDSIYEKYMSAKKGAGLSADDFRKVINKTATEYDISNKGKIQVTMSEISEALESNAIDTSLSEESENPTDNTLSFSLNPNADPTYLVSGFNFSYNDDGNKVLDTVRTAIGGQGIAIAISSGLDGVNLLPSAFKVWMKDIGSFEDGVISEEKTKELVETLVADVKAAEAKLSDDEEGEKEFDESSIRNDWTLLHDNSSDKAASGRSVNINKDLPASIELNRYYIVVVTGKDMDDVDLSQKSLYGFVGNVAGTPPTVSVTTPESLAFIKNSTSEFLKFTGVSKVTTQGTSLKSITVTLTAQDESNKNSEVGVISQTITANKSNEWASSGGLSCVYDGESYSWEFVPSEHSEYEKIKAEKKGLSYLYNIKVSVEGSTGHTAETERSIHIDTVDPIVTLNSATPIVIGKDYYGEDDENYYLNGEIKISATVDEQNLEEVKYDVWASTDLTKTLTAEDSILETLKARASDKVDGSLGKQSTISETFDTTLITSYFESLNAESEDPAIQIEMQITAIDKVGNEVTASTKSIYDKFVIKQETDNPLVHFGNANPEITSSDSLSKTVNMFGTNTNNKLQITISDDDKINSYELYLYEADGTTLAKQNSVYSNKPLVVAVGQSTASISYLLPEKEGEYQVKLIVRDYMPPSDLNPDADTEHSYGRSVTGPFFIVVDDGAPEISDVTPASGKEFNKAFAVSGTIVEGSGKVTLSVSGDGTSAEYSSSKEISGTTGAGAKFNDTIELPKDTNGKYKDGKYTVTYIAEDKYGQSTKYAISYNADTTPPVISSPIATTTGSSTEEGITYFNSNYPLEIAVSVTDATDSYTGTIRDVEYSAYSGNISAPSETSVISWTPLTHKNDSYTGSASGFINADGGNGISDGEYTVFIRATDTAGNETKEENFTTIHLVADKTKPVLKTTTDPENMSGTENDAYFMKEAFSIKGTLVEENLDELYYTLNGEEAKTLPLNDSNWSIASGEIPENGGDFAYIITAIDKAGSVTTLKRTVTIDKKAPQITIDEWKDSTETFVVTNKNSGTVTFSGTVADETKGSGLADVIVYYKNASGAKSVEEKISPNSSGAWTHTFTNLAEGKYTLHIVAKDKAGNEDSIEKSFGVDLTKPASTLNFTGKIFDNSQNTPVLLDSTKEYSAKWNNNVTYLAKESFTLSGTVSDKFTFRAKNVKVTVKKDGGTEETVISSTETEEISSFDWTYTQTVPTEPTDHTADGVYTYNVSASDDAGNIASYSFIVQVDTTAPTLTIVKPASGANFKPASGSTATVTIEGTAFDDGAGAYQVIYNVTKNGEVVRADTEATLTSGKWNAKLELSDSDQGNLVLTVKVTDYLGNSDVSTVSFFCDSIAPTLSNGKVDDATVKDTFYNSTLLNISAEATDAISGVGNITYKLNSDAEKAMLYSAGSADAGKTVTYSAAVNCKEGDNSIVIYATDTNGNKTAESGFIEFNVKVDATAPALTTGSVKIGTSAGNAEVTDNFYYNGKEDMYISGAVTDVLSGVKEVYVLPYSKITDTTATEENKADYVPASEGATDGTFSISISKDSLKQSGTIYARIVDNAGNINDLSLVAFTYDGTAPAIPNASLSGNAVSGTLTSAAYKSGKDTAGNDKYFVNTSEGNTFTFSGVATDNLALAKLELSIDGGVADIAPITEADELSEWSFPGITLTSESKNATLTLTDKAGNTATKTIALVCDVTAPQSQHDKDALGKEYYFRVGDAANGSVTDVGSKYAAGTYGNSTTIKIRGNFEETDSGTSLIYYKLYTDDIPTQDGINEFLADPEGKKTGYFSPLSAKETKTVSINAAGGSTDSVSVESTFKTTISGFTEGSNYLVLLAVDNVGNKALDTITYTYTPEGGSETSLNCYSINVDTKTPSVESKVTETILTNGEGTGDDANITVSGTATDAHSGIDTVTLSITVGGAETTYPATIENATGDDNTENDANKKVWSASIPKSIFSSVTSGNFPVYATAKDKAGDGNKQTVSVAQISVDKIAPEVTLNNPSNADTSAADGVIRINGTISLSGTVKDGNILPENNEDETSNTVTKIRYAKFDTKPDAAPAKDSDSWKDLTVTSIKGNYTFDVAGFVTSSLDNEKYYYIQAVAVDKAGNTGYSNAPLVKISQDTDRPIVKINNLTLTPNGNGYILKYGTEAQVTGTIVDDDSTNTAVVKKLFITETEYNGTGTEPTKNLATANGDFTFQPADSVDGLKTFYIYIEDNAGGKFYTKAAAPITIGNPNTGNPKISVKGVLVAESVNNKEFSYKSDSTSPVARLGEGLPYYAAETSAVAKDDNGEDFTLSTADKQTDNATLNASFKVGGLARRYVKFYFTANDASGVEGMSVEFKDEKGKSIKKLATASKIGSLEFKEDDEFDVSGTFTASSDASTDATWTTDFIDFGSGSVATGQLSVSITPYDYAGLPGNGTYQFYVDNAAPTIKISDPESGDELTGIISISGTASDVGTAGTVNIQWIVPKYEQVTIYTNKSAEEKLDYLKGLTLKGGKDAIAEKHSVSNWKFEFDNNLNPKFDVYDSSTYATNSDCDSTSIYYLPVYFLATDALGNCSVETNFFIKHNPEADKPKLEFTYPTTENYKSSTEQYAVLGGTIRATGSAVIPSGTTTVNSVYYQIATKVVTDNGNGTKTEIWNDFGSADKEKAAGAIASGGYAYTIVSAYDVINELTGKNYSDSTTFTDEQLKDFLKTYGFASRDVLNAWWGIKATGTASWNFKINEKGELNPDSGTTDIRLRVCGVNAEGKFGAWTNDENVIEIHVDNKAPVITYAVNQYANGSAAITALPTDDAATTEIDESKPTASKTYEAEMYLKGNWTFVATLLDETSVTSYNVKVNGSPLTENEGYFVKSGVTAEVELKDGSKTTKYGVTLFVPIPKPAANSETDTVEITVSADDSENHTEQTFDFKIDETAPSFDKLSGNGTLIADNKLDAIEDSNYHFMLDGEAEDNGSGVKNIVFYFMRKNKTTGTIGTDVVMDPMITTGTDDSKVNMKDADGNDALTALEYTQGNDKFYLYANAYSGSATTDTFTSGSDYDAHVRKGGLVQIDGVLRTITGKSGKTVTFTPSLTEAKESVTAYFPIAQVIDNPATERVSSYSTNPFTFERGDDGDNMPESFSGKATKTWSAEIRSANMPDGPVSIVILAFDEAGNVAGKTINTKITNNAPRLAKVFFGTDLSGDKKFTNSSSLTEIVEYDILGAEGATQSSYTLDFNEKLENESAKYPAGTFKIMNGLAVIPELTGGNGNVKMVFKSGAENASAVETTFTNGKSDLIPCGSDGVISSADGKVTATFSGTVAGTFTGSDEAYKMHSYIVGSDSDKLRDDGENKGMSFTFWDSTEETTQGKNSQNAVLYVKNFTVAQTDTTPPTVVVNPFYWNSSSDNSLYANSAKNGHIELEEDLPTDTFKDTNKASENAEAPSGEYDRDPKVSGKIRFTGTAYDNRRLASITVQFGTFLSTATSVATYNAMTGKWTAMAGDGYKFAVTDATSDSVGNFGDSVYFSQKGHKVYWTLDIDTERISTKAATDVKLTVLATDAKIGTGENATERTTSTATTGTYKIVAPEVDETTKVRKVTDGTTNYPIYQMDVVPYIVGVKTGLSSLKKNNSSVYDRTARGHYPVASTETIYVYGFNLEGGTMYDSAETAASAGLTSATASDQKWYSVDAAPSGSVYSADSISAFTSGEVYVLNGADGAKVKSLNNMNNNGAYGKAYPDVPTVNSTGSIYKDRKFYNRQPNGDNNNKLTDDVVLDVWQLNSEAGKPNSGPLSQPVMAINPINKQVGFAFANGPLRFSMGSLDKSYNFWEYGLDFWTSIGFAYDANGNSFGTTAGGDIGGGGKSDSFGIFTSRWGESAFTSGTGGHNNGTGQLRLELIGQAESTNGSSFNGDNIDKQRIKSPSIATTVASSDAEDTTVYLAYYDAINNEIRFKWGIISNSPNNTTGRSQNNLLYDYYGPSNGDGQSDQTQKDTTTKTLSLTQSKLAGSLPYTLEYVSLIAGQTTGKYTFVPGASGTKYTANTAVMTNEEQPQAVCAGQYVSIAAKQGGGDTYERTIQKSVLDANGKATATNVTVSTADDLVVAVWYDATNNQLLYSYNTKPQNIKAPTYKGNNRYIDNGDGTSSGIDSFSQSATGWSTPVAVFGEGNGIGEYCKVALDANGKVHIACYDNANADVWYAYIDDYASPSSAKTCIVDSYGIVGTELYLDVALKDSNPVPYISYYGSSCARPKVAYWAGTKSIATAANIYGAEDEKFTESWETSIIPSSSKISIDHINVGVWKDSSGNLTYSTKNGKDPGVDGTVGVSSAGTENGMIYGNGSMNPILGYAITKAAGGYIETAQMK